MAPDLTPGKEAVLHTQLLLHDLLVTRRSQGSTETQESGLGIKHDIEYIPKCLPGQALLTSVMFFLGT